MKNYPACLALAFLVGCAAQSTRITVNTEPAGGYVTEIGSGAAFGMGPTTVQYEKKNLGNYRDAAGCALVRGFRAQWVSGATAKTENSVRLCGNGDYYTINLNRNPSDPGLDKDLEFALKISAANAQQRQAAAAEAAAAYQLMGVMQQSAPVNCTSLQIGKSLQTSCR